MIHLVILTLTLAQGYASPSMTSPKAVIEVYRPHQFVAGMRKFPIYLDQEKIVEIGNGEMRRILVDPGEHEIRSKTKSRVIDLKVEAGKVYYLKTVIDTVSGFGTVKWFLEEVTEAQGKRDTTIPKE